MKPHATQPEAEISGTALERAQQVLKETATAHAKKLGLNEGAGLDPVVANAINGATMAVYMYQAGGTVAEFRSMLEGFVQNSEAEKAAALKMPQVRGQTADIRFPDGAIERYDQNSRATTMVIGKNTRGDDITGNGMENALIAEVKGVAVAAMIKELGFEPGMAMSTKTT